jgi:hypothetical protein
VDHAGARVRRADLWIAASALFFFYVSNFSSYSATYGAFAAGRDLLVWLWLDHVVLLFGGRAQRGDRLAALAELSRSYDGPPLPAKVPPTRSLGDPGRSVIRSGQEHSAVRPGHSPHSLAVRLLGHPGSARPARARQVEQRVGPRPARPQEVNVALTGSSGRSSSA